METDVAYVPAISRNQKKQPILMGQEPPGDTERVQILI